MSDHSISLSYLKNPVHLLSLGFGTGYMPKLPGTAGTLVGVIIYLPLQSLDWIYYLAIVVALFLLGVWICESTATALGVHDHSAIVWDEIVGYLFTMLAAPAGWVWIVLGFCLFRLFDIWKPWPISLLDKSVHGGIGIMLDDIVAAIFSLIILQVIAYLL